MKCFFQDFKGSLGHARTGHYDESGLLAEYDINGNLIAEYQYWPNSTWMTNPLFKREGSTATLHYYYNGHLGQPLKPSSPNFWHTGAHWDYSRGQSPGHKSGNQCCAL